MTQGKVRLGNKMSFKKASKNNCGISTALSILGDKWTLLIARDIMMGNQNFESIQNNLNISRNLLTERLKAMVAKKLIKRGFSEVYNLYGGVFEWVNQGNLLQNTNGTTDWIHVFDKSFAKWIKNGNVYY